MMSVASPRSVARSVFPLLAIPALLLGGSPGSAQTAPDPEPTRTAPCSAGEYRQFDFWVGEWDVFNTEGIKVGENTITRTMNGCVLHESYSTPTGYHGESFNTWDAPRGVWHQTWVDVGGLLLRLEGGLEGDTMVMRGETVRPNGQRVLNRIAWQPNEDGSVRQHWQSSTDGGTSWATTFDGTYRKR